jgi:hypothetical protein
LRNKRQSNYVLATAGQLYTAHLLFETEHFSVIVVRCASSLIDRELKSLRKARGLKSVRGFSFRRFASIRLATR